MRTLAPLAALAGVACATAEVAPRSSPSVALEEEERGMWRLSGEAQAHVDRSGKLLADEALEAYLLEVARRLEPPEAFAAIPFRIRVIRDARPNAFCLPNGAVYLNTGMLARMESEAELAALLGHEMTHAVNRHALRKLRTSENSGAFWATLGAVAGVGARGGGLLYMASVSGYSRDMERESDRVGLGLVAAAGYRLADAPLLFVRLRDWASAEKLPEGSAFYSSHPNVVERIESSNEILAASGEAGGVRNAESYARRTARALLENARLELASGRYAAAREQLDRYVSGRPGDAAGHLGLGEVTRREAAPGWEDAALASYRRAAELDPTAAEAWRGMGMVLQRKGDRAGARRAFARYLEVAPDAPDREHVRAALRDAPGGTP